MHVNTPLFVFTWRKYLLAKTSIHRKHKPLSQLTPNHFKTVCDRKIKNSYVHSHMLQDRSHLFYAIKWSRQVAYEFWTCLKFRDNSLRSFLCIASHDHCKTVVQCFWILTSVARLFKVVTWIASIYASVLRPWECCKSVAYELATLYHRCTNKV